jgi:hypothetical protein
MAARVSVPILLSLLLLAGCRTYGGHGSEEGKLTQVARLVEWAGQEQGRLSGDELALREGAERIPALVAYLPRLSDLSASLADATSRWASRADRLGPMSSYRELSRALGSMIAERQGYEDRYRRMTDDMAAALAGQEAAPRPASRYQVAPAHYEQLAARLDDQRIRDLVAGVR